MLYYAVIASQISLKTNLPASGRGYRAIAAPVKKK